MYCYYVILYYTGLHEYKLISYIPGVIASFYQFTYKEYARFILARKNDYTTDYVNYASARQIKASSALC